MLNPIRLQNHLIALNAQKKDLAEASGLSIFQISRLFNGKMADTPQVREALAEGLHRLLTPESVG